MSFSNRTTLFANPALIDRYRSRSGLASGTPLYKTKGDASVANSPADYTILKALADQFKAAPMIKGNSGVSNLTLWVGYDSGIDTNSQYPVWQGIAQHCAAFYYLISGDTTYGIPAKDCLLAQVRMNEAGKKGVNFSTWPLPAGGGSKPDYKSGAQEGLLMFRLEEIADLVDPLLTPSERIEIDNYLNLAADYFSATIQAYNAPYLPNRQDFDFTTRKSFAAPTGEKYFTSIGKDPLFIEPTGANNSWAGDNCVYCYRDSTGALKNKVTRYSLWHTNPDAIKIQFLALRARRAIDSAKRAYYKKQVKIWWTEWLIFSVWPDGSTAEWERNMDYNCPPQGALYYGGIVMQAGAICADTFAREGDYDLFNLSTTDGNGGTQCTAGQAPKSFYTVFKMACDILTQTKKLYAGSVNPLYLITTPSTSIYNKYCTWDMSYLPIANGYYNDSYFKDVYTRKAVGIAPIPAGDTSSANKVYLSFNGSGAEFVGTLFQFGQTEDIPRYPSQNVAAPTLSISAPTTIAFGKSSLIITASLTGATGQFKWTLLDSPTGITLQNTVSALNVATSKLTISAVSGKQMPTGTYSFECAVTLPSGIVLKEQNMFVIS